MLYKHKQEYYELGFCIMLSYLTKMSQHLIKDNVENYVYW